MQRLVREWLADGNYDLVQIEGIELAQYAEAVDQRTTAVVFDDHNCEYLLQARNALTDLAMPRRWHAAGYSLVQWAKLRRYEAAICRAADAVLAVSRPDRDALVRIAPAAQITVASNGIDLEPFDESRRVRRAMTCFAWCLRARWTTGPISTRCCGLVGRCGRA